MINQLKRIVRSRPGRRLVAIIIAGSLAATGFLAGPQAVTVGNVASEVIAEAAREPGQVEPCRPLDDPEAGSHE